MKKIDKRAGKKQVKKSQKLYREILTGIKQAIYAVCPKKGAAFKTTAEIVKLNLGRIRKTNLIKMKKVSIKTIDVYQMVLSAFHQKALGIKSSCRFSLTCSNYAKIAIDEKGVIKGGYLSIVRLLKCQPFYKGK